MGFGIMFLGYFAGFVIFLGRLAILRVISSIVIAFSSFKLRKYNRNFNWLLSACVICGMFYAIVSCIDVIEYFTSIRIGGETLRTAFAVLDIPFTFLFHVALLWSIRAIAKETETKKIVFASVRNLVLYSILLLLQLVTLLPFTVTRNLTALAMIFSLALAVLDLLLIFRCYAQICDSNDVDMERKSSRFAFVNSFREESERRNQKVKEERQRLKNKERRRK